MHTLTQTHRYDHTQAHTGRHAHSTHHMSHRYTRTHRHARRTRTHTHIVCAHSDTHMQTRGDRWCMKLHAQHTHVRASTHRHTDPYTRVHTQSSRGSPPPGSSTTSPGALARPPPQPPPHSCCLSPPARPSLQWDLRGHGFPLAGGVADARLLPSVNAPG